MKSAHEPKPQIVILPVVCATDHNTEEQNFSSKVHEIEGSNTSSIFTDQNKRHQVVNCLNGGCHVHHETTTNSSRRLSCSILRACSENQEPFLNGGAANKMNEKIKDVLRELQLKMVCELQTPSFKCSYGVATILLTVFKHLDIIGWLERSKKGKSACNRYQEEEDGASW